MPRHSPLDDPERAAFAWRRYRRLMRFMAAVTLAVVAGVLVLLHRLNGDVPIHFYIATALGIGGAMLLTAMLMGLVFLSSGTGHDESIEDPLEDDHR
jgi:Co/Zn/Cd efflux system component